MVRARGAAVLTLGAIEHQAYLEAILGPIGPQLAARDLHPIVWSAAAGLWDGGHYPQAVQTASVAVEGHLQAKLGPVPWIGEGLATAFSPTTERGPAFDYPASSRAARPGRAPTRGRPPS